jgi:alkaline phosphatase D
MRWCDLQRAGAGRVSLILGAVILSGLATPALAQRSERGYARLMQGPMLGPVSPTSARLWVRGSGVVTYALEYATRPDFSDARRTSEQLSAKGDDYTMVFDLDGLEPGTRYYYHVIADGEISKYEQKQVPTWFETPPATIERFRLSFGSCARFQDEADQQIWRSVQLIEPDLFFWVGDNIYGDSLDPDILAEEYRRQRDVHTLQPIIRSVPQLATWDDHDFGLNDHDRTSPAKEGGLRVFKQYWPNPSYGLPDTPGVFFTYTYGPVEFFFIDCRYHRDPNSATPSPDKTLLGAAQYAWLIESLDASVAVFKVIVSGSGFTLTKGPTGDAWSAFRHERDRLFTEIVDRGIDGVVLMSGDTHVAELNRIPSPHPRGYALTEIVSSPLAQAPSARKPEALPEGEERLRAYSNNSPNAGVVDFDLTGEDPTITVNMVNIYGELVWKPLVIRRSELVIKADRP